MLKQQPSHKLIALYIINFIIYYRLHLQMCRKHAACVITRYKKHNLQLYNQIIIIILTYNIQSSVISHTNLVFPR